MTTSEQQIGALQADVGNLKTDMTQLKQDVREIRDIVIEARGSWRTLVILSGISAAVGGLIVKASAWLPALLGK